MPGLAAYDFGDAIRFGARTLEVEVLTVTDNVGKADAAAMYREIGGTDPGQG